MNTTMKIPIMIIRIAETMPLVPVWNRLPSVRMSDGPRETIPANRMIEMPLPIPFWVMCSPIHMISAVPAVKVIIIVTAARTPVLTEKLPPKPLRSSA